MVANPVPLTLLVTLDYLGIMDRKMIGRCYNKSQDREDGAVGI